MDIPFGTLSHLTGFVIYFFVSAYIAKRYLRRNTDRSLFIATFLTCLWLGVLAYQSHYGTPPFFIRYSFEILRNAAWFGVLYALLGIRFIPANNIERSRRLLSLASMITLMLMLIVTLIEGIAQVDIISGKVLLGGQIILSLIGLILLEQIWRNANIYGRSSIKYLSIAIGAIFGYDFLMYADAFLFQEISTPMWDSRGAINAAIAPLIALTMINSRKQPLEVQVSRQVIFYTGTLVLAGLYLLAISMGGYYLKTFGGSWGDALQVLLFFVAATILVLLLGSPKLRAKLMVFISQNFFHYKYDYREEWLKSTKTLSFSKSEEELPINIIRILAKLVESNSGVLWFKNDDGSFSVKGYLNNPTIKHDIIDANADIVEYFEGYDWMKLANELDVPYINLVHLASDLQWPGNDEVDQYREGYAHAWRNFFVAKSNKDIVCRQLGFEIPNTAIVRNPILVSGKILPYPETAQGYHLALPALLVPIHKGQDVLFRVLAQTKWKKRPIHLNLYGDGDHRRSLQYYCQYLGLRNVHFKGYSENIEEVWAQNHALIMSSRMEGLPLTLFEAMSCGRPAIVPGIAGMKECVQDDETGFIARGVHPDFIDEALERAWQQKDRWQEMGRLAAVRVKEIVPFEPVEEFARILLDLIQD